MKRDVVSVIIPAYNVEKYIRRGIESVLNQTYPYIELVIVDDGSTDNTGNIIEEYAKTDRRINFVKQTNQGVSVARNKAIRMSKGEYIVFLDSDDWLELDTVEFLMSKANGNYDCIVSSGCYFAEITECGDVQKQNSTNLTINEVVSSKEALLTIGTPKYRLSSSCYKLFPSKVIKKYNILFDEKIYNAEDGLFTFQCMKKTERFVYSSEPKWNILARPGSATLSPFNAKKLTALDAMKQMLADESNSEKLNEKIYAYYLIWCLELLSECFNNDRFLYEEISYLRSEVKKIENIGRKKLSKE